MTEANQFVYLNVLKRMKKPKWYIYKLWLQKNQCVHYTV